MNELITYLDFKKIDIRVGTVISAEINDETDQHKAASIAIK